MPHTMEKLTLKDVADLLGTTEGEFSEECRKIFLESNFRYQTLPEDKARELMRELEEQIASGKFSVAGKAKKARWDEGWNENLKEFLENDLSLDAVVPKYMHPVEIIRLNGAYVAPEDPNFEFRLRSIMKCWLFGKYFSSTDPIYEFGCGPGINLVPLAQMFPKKTFYGLDWVEAPKKIIDELGRKYGWNMKGEVFDMFAPNEAFRIEKSGGVLLFSALEQLGTDFETFLDYLIRNKPSVVVHIDSLQELYNLEDPFDRVAFKFAEKRNYLSGYVTKIKELERQGKIKIEKIHHVRFGHMQFFDAYSYDVWRPL